jgi:hypothetical protein
MKRIKAIIPLIIMLALISFASMAFAETIKVKSYKVPVRKGPGFYYKVLKFVERGQNIEVLKKGKRWYKVKVPGGVVGYASARSISYSIEGGKYQGRGKIGMPMRAGGRTSRPMMVAALRGVADMGLFPRQYAEKHGLDPEQVQSLMEVPFNADDYNQFKKSLSPGGGSPNGLSDVEIPEEDREIGTAITMRILAAMPPSMDRRLRKYVSMVGSAVQEESSVYDVPFVFIVLKSEKVNSFSAPGGFIFITQGALDVMDSEAELAGVLSHEVVHVLKRHGMRELEKQDSRIRSAGLMDDLDRELDTRGMDMGDQDVQRDLGDMADQMFEKLVGGRKMVDEDESDALGTLLSSSTGYAPAGLRDFINKSSTKVTGEHQKTYAYRDASRRAQALDSLIAQKGLSKKGALLKDRFKARVK